MALYLSRGMMWAGENGGMIPGTYLLIFSVMEFIYIARFANTRDCVSSPSTRRNFGPATWGTNLLYPF